MNPRLLQARLQTRRHGHEVHAVVREPELVPERALAARADELSELLGVKPDSLKAQERQFDFLNAPRRKGVRRGRRVRLRAVRLLGKMIRQQRQDRELFWLFGAK